MGRREVDEQRGAERKGSRVSCVYWFSDSRRVARSCPKRSGSGRNPFAPLFFFSNHLSCVYLSSGPPETPGACVATCKSRRQLLQLRVSAIWCRVLLGFVPEGAEIHQQRLIDVNKLSALMLRPLVLCLHVGSHHFDKQTNGGQQMPSVDVVRHINRLHLIKVPKGRRRSVTNSLAFWIPPNLLEMVTSWIPTRIPIVARGVWFTQHARASFTQAQSCQAESFRRHMNRLTLLLPLHTQNRTMTTPPVDGTTFAKRNKSRWKKWKTEKKHRNWLNSPLDKIASKQNGKDVRAFLFRGHRLSAVLNSI